MLQASIAALGSPQPSGGQEGSAHDPVARHGHTLLPGKGMKDELKWERKGCYALKDTFTLSADASLIIAVLKVKKLV